MSEGYVLEIVITTLTILSPAGALLGTTGILDGLVSQVVELVPKTLSPASIISDVGNAIVSPFITIWNWLLYNFISPLLVIVFVVLFFVGQYYLLKMYFKFFQYIGANIIKFIGWASQNEKFKKMLNNFVDVTVGK